METTLWAEGEVKACVKTGSGGQASSLGYWPLQVGRGRVNTCRWEGIGDML